MSMARTYASRDEILRQWESEQDSIRLCNRIINGEQDRPLSSMSRPGFVFRTLAMANCIVFSDVVTLPRVVVRDYIKYDDEKSNIKHAFTIFSINILCVAILCIELTE